MTRGGQFEHLSKIVPRKFRRIDRIEDIDM